MGNDLTFPVDEIALANLKHALNGSYTLGDDGDPVLIGADFTVDSLLKFYSGYSSENEIFDGFVGGIETYTYAGIVLSEHDIIRALIAEIERLRGDS